MLKLKVCVMTVFDGLEQLILLATVSFPPVFLLIDHTLIVCNSKEKGDSSLSECVCV